MIYYASSLPLSLWLPHIVLYEAYRWCSKFSGLWQHLPQSSIFHACSSHIVPLIRHSDDPVGLVNYDNTYLHHLFSHVISSCAETPPSSSRRGERTHHRRLLHQDGLHLHHVHHHGALHMHLRRPSHRRLHEAAAETHGSHRRPQGRGWVRFAIIPAFADLFVLPLFVPLRVFLRLLFLPFFTFFAIVLCVSFISFQCDSSFDIVMVIKNLRNWLIVMKEHYEVLFLFL